jgi:signal transduction histidine kinase
VQLNFSTRIQLLLNVGILLSLVVVSVATGSQVISGYRRDLQRTYERRGRTALESLLRRRDLLADTTGRATGYDPALAGLVRNAATLTETDLNLYDAQGQLLVSSQPLIFEAGLLGPLLNPQAVVALRERGQGRVLLTERAGSLSFSALYLPVRVPSESGAAAGPVLGYVGIPFFDSQKALDSKLTELFTTILNIFTIMGLLFLLLAFVATRQLTAPLKVLTERLRRTTLTGQNEVLAYQSSDDEIGLLVREYNTMLGKLEASKRELAAQEKEAAWREMARQVAHEIKNPLTPMKLSLQYLQKAIAENRPNVEVLIGRISQTLITQIDVLSDIATSFSTFTNLPTMRPERLDVGEVLQHCADLFRQQEEDDEHSTLHLALPTDGCVVFADESLLVRTFNNLLLNARQAVPPGRVPRQEVALHCEAGKALITIVDNGSGIDEDVQDKIFRPNFTTKATGSGIGLAVAKRGIESAGGRIWFETTVGEGTTFFIELPLAG